MYVIRIRIPPPIFGTKLIETLQRLVCGFFPYEDSGGLSSHQFQIPGTSVMKDSKHRIFIAAITHAFFDWHPSRRNIQPLIILYPNFL